ncbi:MAG TPA: DUF805 domain-containing protein [Devosia sp.]|nr:DUF805 domain-containing protein [Devosia sp.]
MNTITSLYTTNDGRIARKNWWLGVIGLAVVSIVLALVLGLAGLGPSAATGVGGWGQFIVFLLLLYPSLCLSLKRRHDRDNNGMDVKILFGASVVLQLLQVLGVGLTPTDIGGGVMVAMPATWLTVLYFIFGIAGLYMLVVLGFLRGTAGENSYGANPVGGRWAAAA